MRGTFDPDFAFAATVRAATFLFRALFEVTKQKPAYWRRERILRISVLRTWPILQRMFGLGEKKA